MKVFQEKKQRVSGVRNERHIWDKRHAKSKEKCSICAEMAVTLSVVCQKIACSLLTDCGFLAVCSLLTVCSLLSGCSVREGNDTKVSDLEYTIVEEADLPEELRGMIEEKKAADFKISHETGGELYIVRGYGERDTGGYSIGIQSFYLTANAIIFDTELVGPRKGETVVKSPSYPYIVIKLPSREETIIFE